MQSASILYRTSVIHYSYSEGGHKAAFCFHGYGEQASSFNLLEKNNDQEFSFFAIDLPFHGQTDWKDGLTFTVNDLVDIIDKILIAHPLKQPVPDFKLTLIGFSLGGRIALSLYQAMPEKIEKLILLAPDGLKLNFWYWLVTQTRMGNQFFAFTLKHPGWFMEVLKALNKFKLVNAGIFKFVHSYIDDKEVRRLLYVRWTTFRKLRPDIKRIRSFIIKYNTPVRLLYGKHDRIIRAATGEKFRKGIETQCSLTVIQSGHQVLQDKYSAEILSLLLH